MKNRRLWPLKVKRIRRGNQGKIIGEVEEYFAQQLTPGDTFYFGGEVLRFEAIRDMQLHAKPAKAKEPKIPSYAGGQMPLSTYLAEGVRAILATQTLWKTLPAQVQEWLKLQQAFSQLPSPEKVLVEQFPFRQAHYTLYYTFDGRKANQTLGMLLTRRLAGGSALNAYERYQRLARNDDGTFSPANRRVIQRHRQNIGTIVEAGRLKVKRIRRGNQGKIIGEVEEYFAQQLTPGDTFYFGGEVLRFEAIRDMQLHAKPAKAKEPKIPSYAGGQMPLSTYLAEGVRAILATQTLWKTLPAQVQEWLKLQQAFSQLPSPEKVLVEQFPFRQAHYTLYYTFDGRKANQTLGMLLTRRMEKMGVKPLSFSVTDYGLSVASVNAINQVQLQQLFQPDILGDELEDWMLQAPMLKRSFRQVAVVSGLTEQRYHASQKTMKQVTFSTDLIYDTLREHDRDHILLKVARADAERELLDLRRLANLLIRYVDSATLVNLEKPSPMAIPIVLDVRSEQVKGAGAQAIIEQANLYAEAETMLDEVRALLSGSLVN